MDKGAFQELDQVRTAAPFCKYAGKAASPRDVEPVITAAIKARASHCAQNNLSSADMICWGTCCS